MVRSWQPSRGKSLDKKQMPSFVLPFGDEDYDDHQPKKKKKKRHHD
jgi:hypothetical protein